MNLDKFKRLISNTFTNVGQSFYDSFVEANVNFRARLGREVEIIRRQLGHCCEWCAKLAGIYNARNMSVYIHDNIFRRHSNCRCLVTYNTGDGYQDAWNKKIYQTQREGRINRIKELGNIGKYDFVIGRSLGARALNYEVFDFVSGEKYRFVEGSRIQNTEVFAGKGKRKKYKRAPYYAKKYGGKVEDWQHVKGHGIVETPDGNRKAEVHWSQCEGIGKFDFFVKKWDD